MVGAFLRFFRSTRRKMIYSLVDQLNETTANDFDRKIQAKYEEKRERDEERWWKASHSQQRQDAGRDKSSSESSTRKEQAREFTILWPGTD